MGGGGGLAQRPSRSPKQKVLIVVTCIVETDSKIFVFYDELLRGMEEGRGGGEHDREMSQLKLSISGSKFSVVITTKKPV